MLEWMWLSYLSRISNYSSVVANFIDNINQILYLTYSIAFFVSFEGK